jgi:pimeloyl-ACP methyl ester carboxylesterase
VIPTSGAQRRPQIADRESMCSVVKVGHTSDDQTACQDLHFAPLSSPFSLVYYNIIFMQISQGVEEKKIVIKGLKVNYKIVGKGLPFLILHGWGGSSDSWIEVQNQISKQGFQVIVPDFPGFGKSPAPKDPWNVDSYVNWLNDFIIEINKTRSELTEPIFLLGHSFGGRIAIKFAVKYPERVQNLILCSSAGIKLEVGPQQKIFYYLAKIGDYLFSQKPFRRFKNRARNVFYQIIRRKDYLKANGVMKETIKNILGEDLLDYLPKVRNRTLILWGKLDKMIPVKYAYIMKEKIPNSQLIILPKVGHSPQLDIPEKLSQTLIQFLKP